MLQDSLSEGLRLVRTQRGLTREELARQARGYGLRWHGTTVTEIEAGRRHLRLEQLLLLALALDASPADFVAGDEPVHLTADARVGVRTVRGLLAGRLDDHDDVLEIPQSRAFVAALRAGSGVLAKLNEMLGTDDRTRGQVLQDVRRAEESVDEAVRKGAGPLDVEPVVFAAAAIRLYGRSFTEERDARVEKDGPAVSPRVRQARRGHASRQLIAEIRGFLDQIGSGAGDDAARQTR